MDPLRGWGAVLSVTDRGWESGVEEDSHALRH